MAQYPRSQSQFDDPHRIALNLQGTLLTQQRKQMVTYLPRPFVTR
jgi:hypothetical protein